MNARHAELQAIDTIASEWVLRVTGSSSAHHQTELAAWLAADPRHAAAFARLSRTSAVFDRAQQKGLSGEIVLRLAQRQRRRHRRRMQLSAIAAILLLGGFWFSLRPRSGPVADANGEMTAGAGQIRKLPDGTVVELNRGAVIKVAYDATIRRVTLVKGEAHFRVAKDAVHPFRVQAGNVDVTAVGTAFTVQLATREVEVVVTEGRVAVGQDKSESPSRALPALVISTFVNAGNHVIMPMKVSSSSPAVIQPMSQAEIERRLQWRLALVEFETTELAQAVELINRSNRIQISLADASLNQLHISGKIRADNPDGFVHILEETFDLKADRPSENEIVLRRR